jgi:hypothetical protein
MFVPLSLSHFRQSISATALDALATLLKHCTDENKAHKHIEDASAAVTL